MNRQSRTHAEKRRLAGAHRSDGASLLAWIAVVAIMAILLSILIPTLIREIDHRVAREEQARLEVFGSALKAAVQRYGVIPSENEWAATVANEAGYSTAAVATNPRQRPRLLLIDTNGWFNAETLPYTQTPAGTVRPPVNARMMILSSLGGPPLPFTSGRPNKTDFQALWQAAEGTASFPTTGAWAGWNGNSADVKVERVNLSSLFVTLFLLTHETELQQGRYSIGADPTIYTANYQSTQSAPVPTYFLLSTPINLYTAAGALDARHILIRDSSYLYMNGVWKSSGGGGAMPGGTDLAAAVAQFLRAIPNQNARFPDQQMRVVQSMMNYMSNYNVWAAGNFLDANLKDHLVNNVQPAMIANCRDLFQGSYYPTNSTGPQ